MGLVYPGLISLKFNVKVITHNRISIFLVTITCGVLVGLKPDVVLAHGFGDRYDLPIPLSFYMMGAAMTVVLSFFFIWVFL